MEGKTLEATIPSGKTVLQALLDAGYDIAYSCQSGVCSTCIAKVNKGEVTMERYNALDDEEVEEGLILACQAKPTTAELVVDFDV